MLVKKIVVKLMVTDLPDALKAALASSFERQFSVKAIVHDRHALLFPSSLGFLFEVSFW